MVAGLEMAESVLTASAVEHGQKVAVEQRAWWKWCGADGWAEARPVGVGITAESRDAVMVLGLLFFLFFFLLSVLNPCSLLVYLFFFHLIAALAELWWR